MMLVTNIFLGKLKEPNGLEVVGDEELEATWVADLFQQFGHNGAVGSVESNEDQHRTLLRYGRNIAC